MRLLPLSSMTDPPSLHAEVDARGCIGWGSGARLFSCSPAAARALPVADVQVDWSSSLERAYQWQQDTAESRLDSRRLPERQGLAGQDIRGQVVEDELNLVFDQLPDWFDSRQFDWSGNTNYTAMNRELQSNLPRVSSAEAGTCKRVFLGGRLGWMNMVTLWIGIHQLDDFEMARVYESTTPLDDGVCEALSSPLKPFALVPGLTFNRCDERNGTWRNYLVGVVGSMADKEEDILWPNQVLHGDRTAHNLRGPEDLARFLADPTKAGIEHHLENLRVLQQERNYREGWCHLMLKSRWGSRALEEFDIR